MFPTSVSSVEKAKFKRNCAARTEIAKRENLSSCLRFPSLTWSRAIKSTLETSKAKLELGGGCWWGCIENIV